MFGGAPINQNCEKKRINDHRDWKIKKKSQNVIWKIGKAEEDWRKVPTNENNPNTRGKAKCNKKEKSWTENSKKPKSKS
jgi:hypothetical protein